MNNMTSRSILRFSLFISYARQKLYSSTCIRQISVKLFKTYRLGPVKPLKFSSLLLSGTFLVKAISNQEKSENYEIIIKQADNLYDEGNFEQLHALLETHSLCNDPEILWRLARAHYEISRNLPVKERLVHLEEALLLADKALEISELCWAAHKWKAILLNCTWQLKSVKGRILHSVSIKQHLQRAVDLNPKDSTSFYSLGEWCYAMKDMRWYQRQAASAIFASPPTSTFEEALYFFEKAEEANPLFYSMNLLMLGKTHLKLDDKKKAVKFLKQVVDYPIKTADDKTAHEEAEKLLKDLKD